MATALLIVTYVMLCVFFTLKRLEKRRVSVNSLTSVDFHQNTALLEHEVGMLPHIDSRVADACVTCKEKVIADSYVAFALSVNEARQLNRTYDEFAPGTKFMTLDEAWRKGYPPSLVAGTKTEVATPLKFRVRP